MRTSQRSRVLRVVTLFGAALLVAGRLGVGGPEPVEPSRAGAESPLAEEALEQEGAGDGDRTAPLDPAGARSASIHRIEIHPSSIEVDLRRYRSPAPVRREVEPEEHAPAWSSPSDRPGTIPTLPEQAPDRAVLATGGTLTPPDESVGTGVATAPGPDHLFRGLGWADWGCGRPSDPNGDVGPVHYLQAVNCSIGIFDKSSGSLLAATTLNGLAAATGTATGTACDAHNEGDPVVVYDTFGDRWIVTDFAFTRDPVTGKSNSMTYECVFVSKSGDPTGGWWLYPIRTSDSSGDLADYPKVGVWRDGIYLTFNLFGPAGFKNVRFLALERERIERGEAGTAFIGDLPQVSGTTVFAALPANARLQTGTPPAGMPALLSTVWGGPTVRTWSVSIPDWTNGTRATVTGPTSVAIPTFTAAPTTAATPANANDTLSPRLMMQSQYLRRPEGDSIVLTHTIANPAKTTVATARWYQVGLSDGSAVRLLRMATANPDVTIHRYMPSLAVDAAGDVAVGYSASAATVAPQLRASSWSSGDSTGSAGGGERILYYAAGAQDTTTAWGDYSAMSLDPDGCTFWYTGSIYAATGRDWQTGIAAFSLPSCTGVAPLPAPAPVLTLTSASDGGTAIADPGAVLLAWTPPAVTPMTGPATGYRIERSTGSGWVSIGSAPSGSSWRDLSVLPGTTYAYRVVAFDPGGEAAPSPVTVIRTVAAPAAPTSLATTTASASAITVGWRDNATNEWGYEVQFATVSTGPWYRWYVGANVTTFTKDGLKAATTYYFRVRAIREFASAWTTALAAKTTR